VVAAIPALVLTFLALARPTPPTLRRLVLGLTVLGCAAFVLVYAGSLGQEGGLEAALRTATAQTVQQLRQESGTALPPETEQMMPAIARAATGGVIAVWLLLIAGNAALAQGVLVRFERNLLPSLPMASLDLPSAVSTAFAAALAAWLFGPGQVAFIGGNLAEILVVPLTLGGLAVIHMAVRRHPARLLMLIGVYVVALFLWPIVPIVAIGVIDEWVGLRQRLAAGSNRGEK
jgi:hypothetical protein